MLRIGSLIFALLILFGCKTSISTLNSAESSVEINFLESDGIHDGGIIQGSVKDSETGETLPFVKVLIENEEELVTGATTDIDGLFHFKNIARGTFTMSFEFIGYESYTTEELTIGRGESLEINVALKNQDNAVIEKPIVYLYPEEAMDVQVTVNYDGEITHTYPKTENSWKVHATPEGKLTDSNGRNYYGLFWEGIPNSLIQPHCGTVVSKDSLIPFLEASLDQLGLNYKEANEFIVYWLPTLEKSPYNLIYFAQKDYTDLAELKVEPRPQTMIRVMMGYVPMNQPMEFAPQVLPEKLEREGFTIVEWGGTKCSFPNP